MMEWKIKLYNRHISDTVWAAMSVQERMDLLRAIEKENDELKNAWIERYYPYKKAI